MKRVEKRIEVRLHSSGLILLLLNLNSCPKTDHNTEDDLEYENANQSNLLASKWDTFIIISKIDKIIEPVCAGYLALLVVSTFDQINLIGRSNSISFSRRRIIILSL